MSTPLNPEDQRRDQKSKIYFLIAGALLLIMGLVWSLDAFFVYVSLGAAVFFLFLGFRNRRVSTPLPPRHKYYERPRQQQTQKPPGTTSQVTNSAFEELKKAFEKDSGTQYQSQSHSQPRPQPQSPQQQKNVRTVVLSCAFIAFVFTIIFVSAVFLESESYLEDATIYYSTAEQFQWSGQYDSAKVYYRRALREEPEYTEAFNGYGISLMNSGDNDSAIIMYDKALEINPDYEYATYNKSLAFFYKKNYGQSRKIALNLLDKSPNYYDAMVLAGDGYYVESQNDSAFYWYQQAYDNGVRSPGLSRVLAEIHDSKSNREKAIEFYKESLGQDSTNVKIYERLGELLPGRDGDVFRKEGRKWKEAGY
jgi:tetratricopeptide (TPR) repeat protein